MFPIGSVNAVSSINTVNNADSSLNSFVSRLDKYIHQYAKHSLYAVVDGKINNELLKDLKRYADMEPRAILPQAMHITELYKIAQQNKDLVNKLYTERYSSGGCVLGDVYESRL